jgi:hypothetical protein
LPQIPQEGPYSVTFEFDRLQRGDENSFANCPLRLDYST